VINYLEVIETIPINTVSSNSSSEDNSSVQAAQPPVILHSTARDASLVDASNASYVCLQTTDLADSTSQLENYRADLVGKNYVARNHVHKHDDHLPCTVQIIETVDSNPAPTQEDLDARLVLSMSTDVTETYELPTVYKVEAKDEDDLAIKQSAVTSSVFAGKMVPNISSNLKKK
jgi:hypothetical protein